MVLHMLGLRASLLFLALARGGAKSAGASCDVDDDDELDDELSGGALRPWTLPDIDPVALAGDELRQRDWTRLGAMHWESGRHELALQHMIVATKAQVFSAYNWANLGNVLMDMAEMIQDGDGAVEYLCESICAYDLVASVAGDPTFRSSISNRQKGAIQVLGGTAGFERRCTAGKMSRYGRARRALGLLAKGGKHDAAVAALCKPDATELTVTMRTWEMRRGVLSAATTYELWALFRVCGVVALRDAIEAPVVQRVRAAIEVSLAEAMPTIEAYREQQEQQQARSTGGGFAILQSETLASRDRSGTRYELKLPHHKPPYNSSVVDRCQPLMRLVRIIVACGMWRGMWRGTWRGVWCGTRRGMWRVWVEQIAHPHADSACRSAVDYCLRIPHAESACKCACSSCSAESMGRVQPHPPRLLPHLLPDLAATASSLSQLFLMSGALTLDTYSVVVSLPGSPAGGWHEDVEDPFAFHGIGRSRSHPPPPGLVVIVPLVDVNSTNGPTAFRLGSHVKVDGGMFEVEGSKGRRLRRASSRSSCVRPGDSRPLKPAAPLTAWLHSVASQRRFTVALHSGASQRRFTAALHSSASQRRFTAWLHSVASQRSL